MLTDIVKSKKPKKALTAGLISEYRQKQRKKILLVLGGILLMIVLAIYDLSIGAYNLSFTDVYRIIFERLLDWNASKTTPVMVVWDLRMPRILTAIIAGAGLAIGGAAMQSMLKNPLADPYTTGISAGASFGVTIAILLGFTIINGSAGIIISAFIFSLIPTAFILFLSKVRRTPPTMMILAGIAIMYIFNAGVSYLMLHADPNGAAAVFNWTVGTLDRVSWKTLPAMLAVVFAGSAAIMYLSRQLNAINSGDAFAKSIGINVERLKIIILLLVSLVAAAVVSFTGTIGFIGIVAPHIARILVGSDNKFLIPSAALCGAMLLLISDVISHSMGPSTIPVGIVTAFIGGPLFIYLILKQKKQVW